MIFADFFCVIFLDQNVTIPRNHILLMTNDVTLIYGERMINGDYKLAKELIK